MVDETANALRAEIDHLRRLVDLVTDAQVRAEIRRMIEELERRLREIEPRHDLDGQRASRPDYAPTYPEMAAFDHRLRR
jgi:hypothetical protein